MLLAGVLALVGLGLLTVAADHLVLGAGRVARRLGISAVVVGVVVIGLGTSAPEFLVSGLAAAEGQSELGLANLVGSNIINITLILGVAAIIAPVVVHARVPRLEAPLAVAATALFGVLAYLGLGLIAGLILAAAFGAALVLLLRLARDEPGDAIGPEATDLLDPAEPDAALGWEVVRTLLGLAGTIGGAQILVTNAEKLATDLGVSPTVIGFTLVAIGTSLPELVTAIQAQRRGDTDLLVGNLLGSNLFNSVAGGAIVGIFGRADPATLGWPILTAMVAAALIAWALLARGDRIGRRGAIVLLAVYAATLPLIL